MKYYSDNEYYINAECQSCKRVLKIKKDRCLPYSDSFSVNPPIKCVCGKTSDRIAKPIKTCLKCGLQILHSQIFCDNCKEDSSVLQIKGDSSNWSGLIFVAIIIFLLGIAIHSISTTNTETTADKPDFRPWFDKPKSEWTEKDNREYLEFHIKRMNEKAEQEKAFK